MRLLEKKGQKLDLVFLDPPYKEHYINKILTYLVQKQLLQKGSLIICEVAKDEVLTSEHLTLFKERSYGDKKVLIYQY